MLHQQRFQTAQMTLKVIQGHSLGLDRVSSY